MSDLPPNVRPVFDRHGKVRYRFRRKGWASAYVKGEPGTAEFHRSLAEIIERGGAEKAPARRPIGRCWRTRRCPTCCPPSRWKNVQPQKKVAIPMLNKGDGARGRSDATTHNQALGCVQPSGLTDGSLPSPAVALSNLFDVVPRSGISCTATRAMALRAGEVG